MSIAPLKQNPTPGQIAVRLIGRTVGDNKPPGVAHSATIMNAVPRPFSVGTPPPIRSSGIGRNLDVTA